MTKHWLISARVIHRQEVDSNTQEPVTDKFGEEIPAEEENLGPEMVVADSRDAAIIEYDKVKTAEYRRRMAQGTDGRNDIDRVEHFTCEMDGPFTVEEQPTLVQGGKKS